MAYRRVLLIGDKLQDTKKNLEDMFSSKLFKTNYAGVKTKIIVSPVKNDTLVVDLNGEGADSVAKKVKDIGVKYQMKTTIKTEKPMSPVKENDTKKPEMSDDELMKKIKSSLTFQVTGGKKGKPGLKEALDKRLAIVFLKYKDKSFPMDYKTGSMFEKFVTDLQKSGAFNSEDEVSDFMSSDEFDTYANKFNVNIDYADYDPTPLTLAPKEPVSAQDMVPGRAPQDFISADLPHRVSDLMEKLKKTGKLKKSELKELLLFENMGSKVSNWDDLYDEWYSLGDKKSSFISWLKNHFNPPTYKR